MPDDDQQVPTSMLDSLISLPLVAYQQGTTHANEWARLCQAQLSPQHSLQIHNTSEDQRHGKREGSNSSAEQDASIINDIVCVDLHESDWIRRICGEMNRNAEQAERHYASWSMAEDKSVAPYAQSPDASPRSRQQDTQPKQSTAGSGVATKPSKSLATQSAHMLDCIEAHPVLSLLSGHMWSPYRLEEQSCHDNKDVYDRWEGTHHAQQTTASFSRYRIRDALWETGCPSGMPRGVLPALYPLDDNRPHSHTQWSPHTSPVSEHCLYDMVHELESQVSRSRSGDMMLGNETERQSVRSPMRPEVLSTSVVTTRRLNSGDVFVTTVVRSRQADGSDEVVEESFKTQAEGMAMRAPSKKEGCNNNKATQDVVFPKTPRTLGQGWFWSG